MATVVAAPLYRDRPLGNDSTGVPQATDIHDWISLPYATPTCARREAMTLRPIACLLLAGLALASSAALATAAPKHAIHVDGFRVERDITPGRNKVVGTLTNVSHARVHRITIRFVLFDAKGRRLGTATDETHDLAPGHAWKFHAPARGNVSRARIDRLETR